MKVIRWTEVFWLVIPIKISLKMWGFSDAFLNYMIYPSLALFLGTGQATPDLPTVMMERLYTSPTYGMCALSRSAAMLIVQGIRSTPRASRRVCRRWCANHSPDRLISQVVFPKLSEFYTDWQKRLESKGVTVRLSTEVDAVLERGKKGVRILTRPRRPQPDNHNPNDADQDLPQTEEQYDEIVLCVLADTAKRLLGKTSRWIDRAVLGSAKWADGASLGSAAQADSAQTSPSRTTTPST